MALSALYVSPVPITNYFESAFVKLGLGLTRVCGDCGHFDPELDMHPWFLAGCALKDTKWGVAHRGTDPACDDFTVKVDEDE